MRATVIAVALAVACLGLTVGMTRYHSLSQRPAQAFTALIALSVAGDLSLANAPDTLALFDLVVVITAVGAIVGIRRGINPTTHAPGQPT